MRIALLGGLLLLACRPAGPAVRQLRIVATDYAYQVPDTIPAGIVRVTILNRGAMVHEALLTRLAGNETTAGMYVDSVRAGVLFPAMARDAGGPGAIGPGDSATAWIRLIPGRYAIVCWMGDHLKRGMAHDLVVTESDGMVTPPPQEDQVVTLVNYAFGRSGDLSPGHHVIRMENRGAEYHEAGLYRLPQGVSARDQIDWIERGEVGASPAQPVGGIGDMPPGDIVWAEITLTPGHYLWLCTVPDSAGTSHYRLGMMSEFEIP